MSSPDRMEMLARAIQNIMAAVDEMDRQQKANDVRMQQHQEWVQRHEEQVEEWERQIEQSRQAHEGWLRGHNEWLRSHNQRIAELQRQSERHGDRVREILGVIAEMQADIARLDAAS